MPKEGEIVSLLVETGKVNMCVCVCGCVFKRTVAVNKKEGREILVDL